MSETKPSALRRDGKDILPDAIIIHSNGIVRFINPAGLRLFSISSADDVVGKDIYGFIRTEDHECVKERLRQIESEEIFQSPLQKMKLIDCHGSLLNTEVTAVCAQYKGLPAVMSLIIDRGNRKDKEEGSLNQQSAENEALHRQAEEKAMAAEYKSRGLEELLGTIAEGIAMYDAGGKVSWVNSAHKTLMGGDVAGLTWDEWNSKFEQMSFHYPDGWLVSQEEYPAIRALRGKTISNEVLVFNNLKNVNKMISVSGRPLMEEGKIIGAVIIMQDITEQEQKLDKLTASYRKITDILESINEGFLFIDYEWRIAYANRRILKILGLIEDEFGFTCIWDKFPKLFDSQIGENLRQAMEGKTSCRFEFNTKLTKRQYLATVYPAAGGISIYVIDMTARIK